MWYALLLCVNLICQLSLYSKQLFPVKERIEWRKIRGKGEKIKESKGGQRDWGTEPKEAAQRKKEGRKHFLFFSFSKQTQGTKWDYITTTIFILKNCSKL